MLAFQFCVHYTAGTATLVVTSLDVDTTGSSYYGEQMLHFLEIGGETSNVTLGKLEHSVQFAYFSSHYSKMCVLLIG